MDSQLHSPGAGPAPEPGAPSGIARAPPASRRQPQPMVHAPSGRCLAGREPSPPRAAVRSAPGGAEQSRAVSAAHTSGAPGQAAQGEGDALTMSAAAPRPPSWLGPQRHRFAAPRLTAVRAQPRALTNQRPAHGSDVLNQPIGMRAPAAPQTVAAILWRAGRMVARSRIV